MSNYRYNIPVYIDSSINNTSDPVGSTGDIRQSFNESINIDPKQSYRAALIDLTTSYSWYNISDDNNNRLFHYTVSGTPFTITLDEGVYTFVTLVDAIHAGLLSNGHATLVGGTYVYEINFTVDLANNIVTCILSDVAYTVVWDTNLRMIFGFNAITQSSTRNGDFELDIFAEVSQVLVCSDLVQGNTISNGRRSDVLYSFNANTFAPNETLVIEPTNLLWIDLAHKSEIRNIRVYLRDQLQRPIKLRGAQLGLTIKIESR